MPITAQQAQDVYTEADLLYSGQEVEAALARMAQDISAQLKDSNPIIVCVMTGGIVPTGMLLPQLNFPLQLDYIHTTRYRGETQGGELHCLAKPVHSLQGRTVLVVDDILDEGHTLAAILADCQLAGAREVFSAVLVDKIHQRRQGVQADFVGLEVPDRFVFGYGMDIHGAWRNLPAIHAVKEQ